MSKKPLKVIAGEPDKPLVIGDIEIPCYVLEDETRVLSQRGVDKALGRGRPRKKGIGDEFPSFLRPKVLKPYINKDLLLATSKSIPYLLPNGIMALGLKAELLHDVCTVWTDADRASALTGNQKSIAERAYILLKGFGKVGIIALIDEATGYQDIRAKHALAEILEQYISEELQPWTKTFPIEFYREIFRLKGWDLPALAEGKKPHTPQVIGHYTNDIVYNRLAPGVLEELRRKNPTTKPGKRATRHHQWFTPDFGNPKLREHLAAVIALMKASPNWDAFMRSIKRVFPTQEERMDAPKDR